MYFKEENGAFVTGVMNEGGFAGKYNMADEVEALNADIDADVLFAGDHTITNVVCTPPDPNAAPVPTCPDP